jgi:hypothetical protein
MFCSAAGLQRFARAHQSSRTPAVHTISAHLGNPGPARRLTTVGRPTARPTRAAPTAPFRPCIGPRRGGAYYRHNKEHHGPRTNSVSATKAGARAWYYLDARRRVSPRDGAVVRTEVLARRSEVASLADVLSGRRHHKYQCERLHDRFQIPGRALFGAFGVSECANARLIHIFRRVHGRYVASG